MSNPRGLIASKTLVPAVTAGTIELKKAINSMPRLARVGGACPCSNSVRWVVDAPDGPSGGAERLNP